MGLVRLVYCSRHAEGRSTSEVDDLAAFAAARNAQDGITGMLVYGGRMFLQVVEGGRVPINRLYQRLQHDHRHVELVLLSYESVRERQFDRWGMAHTTLEDVARNSVGRVTLLRYTPGYFDPYEMSEASALGLLSAASRQIGAAPHAQETWQPVDRV